MADIITSSTSNDIDSTASAGEVIEFEFVLENGMDGVISVSDELLDTQESAEERAKSEFLQNSYKKKEVQFDTYRTDLEKNDIIIVEGLKFIIKNIQVIIDKVAMVSTIRAIRYED